MPAAEQLCLLDLAEADATALEHDVDIVDSILDYHHGDYRQALRDLLADADFLRDQLHTASWLMSKGMGRGWRPKYERV